VAARVRKYSSVSRFVSIIVPAYNEEDNVSPCVRQLVDAFSSSKYDFEILLVNDGSTDKTLETATRLLTDFQQLRLLDLRRNYGKTVALREGVRRAKGNLVAFFDADLQYDVQDVVKLAELTDHRADVVCGRRDYQEYGSTRTTLSLLYNMILRIVFGLSVSDSNCGVKVLVRESVDTNYVFRYGLPLVVPLLKLKGWRIAELPVSLRRRKAGVSKYYREGSFLGGWKFFREISVHSAMLLTLLVGLVLRGRKVIASQTGNSSQSI